MSDDGRTREEQPLLRVDSARGRRMKGSKCVQCLTSRGCCALLCCIMILTVAIAVVLAVLISYGVIDKEVDRYIAKVRI